MNKGFDIFCKCSMVFVLFICLNSVVGDIIFRLQYCLPKVTYTSNKPIITSSEPVQKNLDGKKSVKTFGEKHGYILNLQAEYSISALVLTKNTNFWFRDIMRSRFDDICLMDLGLAWGELAQNPKELYKNWKFKSYKSLGMGRRLEWRTKSGYSDASWNLSYVSSHVAHTHLIPASPNVMSALLKIKKNDIVKLDGYLVDIFDADTSQIIAKTSLSRTDTDPASRGYGACEDMYVKRVQIGDKVYE